MLYSMRKVILFLALLLLVGCGQQPINKSLNNTDVSFNDSVVNESKDNESFSNNSKGGENVGVDAGVNATVESDLESAENITELLKELKERQKRIYDKRIEVVNQRREIRGIINSNISFEDRQFYDKVYAILGEKKSELTLEAQLLESRIKHLEKKVERGKTLRQFKNRLEELKQEEKEIKVDLKNVSKEIIKVRQELVNNYSSDVQNRLKSLQSREEDLLSQLNDVRDEINEKRNQIDEFNTTINFTTDKELLIERQALTTELSVVRNKIANKYVELSKASSDEEVQRIRDEIDKLDDREKELRSKIRSIDEQLKS